MLNESMKYYSINPLLLVYLVMIIYYNYIVNMMISIRSVCFHAQLAQRILNDPYLFLSVVKVTQK